MPGFVQGCHTQACQQRGKQGHLGQSLIAVHSVGGMVAPQADHQGRQRKQCAAQPFSSGSLADQNSQQRPVHQRMHNDVHTVCADITFQPISKHRRKGEKGEEPAPLQSQRFPEAFGLTPQHFPCRSVGHFIIARQVVELVVAAQRRQQGHTKMPHSRHQRHRQQGPPEPAGPDGFAGLFPQIALFALHVCTCSLFPLAFSVPAEIPRSPHPSLPECHRRPAILCRNGRSSPCIPQYASGAASRRLP